MMANHPSGASPARIVVGDAATYKSTKVHQPYAMVNKTKETYAKVNKTKQNGNPEATREQDPIGDRHDDTAYCQIDRCVAEFICTFAAKPALDFRQMTGDNPLLDGRVVQLVKSENQELLRLYDMYKPMVDVKQVSSTESPTLARVLEEDKVQFVLDQNIKGVDIICYKKDKFRIDQLIKPVLNAEQQKTPGGNQSVKVKPKVPEKKPMSIIDEEDAGSEEEVSPPLPQRPDDPPPNDITRQYSNRSKRHEVKTMSPPRTRRENRPDGKERSSPRPGTTDVKTQATETIPAYAIGRFPERSPTNGTLTPPRHASPPPAEGEYSTVTELSLSRPTFPSSGDYANAEEPQANEVTDETIPPYATTRLNNCPGTAKNDEAATGDADENDYEVVDMRPRGPAASGPTTDTASQRSDVLTVVKQFYNFLCQFEENVPQASATGVGTDREIDVTFSSDSDLRQFRDLYDRVVPELWLEGIKTESIAGVSDVINRLESEFQCLVSRPHDASLDMEIVCRRADSASVRAVLGAGGGTVSCLYQMAAEILAEENSRGYSIGDSTVYVHIADITKVKVDAIVNAANRMLYNGGGVAKVISEAGGPTYAKSCKEYIAKNGPIPVSQVAVTEPGNLPCKKVLNVVGPQWSKKDSEAQRKCRTQVEEAFRNILTVARDLKLDSVAVPPVSAGLYKVPSDAVALALSDALTKSLASEGRPLTVHVVDIRLDVLRPLLEILEISRSARALSPAAVRAALRLAVPDTTGLHGKKSSARPRWRVKFSKEKTTADF